MSEQRNVSTPLDVGPLIEEVLTTLQAVKKEVTGYREEVRLLTDEVTRLRKETTTPAAQARS